MDLLSNNTTITLPRGRPEKGTFEVSLDLLIKAEQRKQEMSYVNKKTAPELMYCFNEAYCEASKLMVQIGLECNRAAEAVEERKAVVLLDIVPEELKRRNLASARSPGGSEDFRTAVLTLDAEFKDRNERAETLRAFHQLLKIKVRGLEMAFQTVKKIFDPYESMPETASKLKAGNDDDSDNIFGKAKYKVTK